MCVLFFHEGDTSWQGQWNISDSISHRPVKYIMNFIGIEFKGLSVLLKSYLAFSELDLVLFTVKKSYL